jgi:phage repressor protein C with HTH and peptisase S24 domain
MRPIKDIRRENVAQLVRYAGGQAAFAAKLGKDRNQVYQWLLPPENPSSRGISDPMAREIERVSSLVPGALDHEGSLSGAREPEAQQEIVSQVIQRFETRPGYRRFQVMGEGGAGPGVLNMDFPEVVRELEIAEWRLQEELGRVPSPQRVKLMTVRGNSNAPRIRNGDIVFVDVDDKVPADGALFAIVLHGYTLVKKIEIRRDGFHVVSLADPGRPDIYAPDQSDELVIAGRVLGAMQLRKAEDL